MENIIFANQTNLEIELTTGVNLLGCSAKIKYIKPSGNEGEFVAQITDENQGIIKYTIQSANDVDEYGIWKFYAEITFSDLTVACGAVIEKEIFKKGQVK